jgi:hypothetical protein
MPEGSRVPLPDDFGARPEDVSIEGVPSVPHSGNSPEPPALPPGNSEGIDPSRAPVPLGVGGDDSVVVGEVIETDPTETDVSYARTANPAAAQRTWLQRIPVASRASRFGLAIGSLALLCCVGTAIVTRGREYRAPGPMAAATDSGSNTNVLRAIVWDPRGPEHIENLYGELTRLQQTGENGRDVEQVGSERKMRRVQDLNDGINALVRDPQAELDRSIAYIDELAAQGIISLASAEEQKNRLRGSVPAAAAEWRQVPNDQRLSYLMRQWYAKYGQTPEDAAMVCGVAKQVELLGHPDVVPDECETVASD